MDRRTFLKSFGAALAAMGSNLVLSKLGISAGARKTFRPMTDDPDVTGFDWYLDSIDGSDGNDGLSSATPLKTIAALISKPITAGQTVGLRCGSVFRETLTVPSSGSAGSPITYKSYGIGAAPRILGSGALSAWTQADIPAVPADILSEGFETTLPEQNGYDAGVWTETAAEGCLIDPDNADIAHLDGSTQALKIQKASPGFDAEIEKDLGTEFAASFTSLSIYIAEEGLSSGDSVCLLRERDASGEDVIAVYLNKSGTQLRFAITVFNHGETDYAYYNIRTARWYRVNLMYDSIHHTYEAYVNGNAAVSGALTGVIRTGIQIMNLGDSSHSNTLTAYFDALLIGSTNYPTAALALPAYCYRASIDRPPRELYFEQTTGKVRRGRVQTTIGSCDEEFEWFYHMSGYVVLYAPSDPGARYHAVEAGMRRNCIAHNNQTFITIDGLEVAYSVQDTISAASNWTVQNCDSHHANRISILAGGYYGGVYGSNASNCVVRNCRIHDHPCKGIQFEASSGASISGNLIEQNIFYDNSDFSIDCQVFDSGSAHSGLVIQYNEFYTTTDWESNTTGANGIYTSGHVGFPMVGPVVRYNLFHDMGGNGVQVGPSVNGMQVYNNTFARTLAGYDGISNAIYADPTSEAWTIENNIGYGFNYQMYIPEIAGAAEVDHNCWYAAGAGNFIYAGGSTYRVNDFAAYQAATGWDAHGAWTDPMFASPSDFHLQPGSPCINTGIDMGITHDFAGIALVKLPEMGAYEHQPTPQQAVVVLSNLKQTYDGSPRNVSVTTTPPGVAVSLLYTGISGTIYSPSDQAPVHPGAYKVDATITDPDYFGSTSGILIINQKIYLPWVWAA